MHSGKSKWRPLALLVPIALMAAAFAVFLGGTDSNFRSHQEASAVANTIGNAVICIDSYLGYPIVNTNNTVDRPNFVGQLLDPTQKGQPPETADGTGDPLFRIAVALIRLDDDGSHGGTADDGIPDSASSVTYLGPDKKPDHEPEGQHPFIGFLINVVEPILQVATNDPDLDLGDGIADVSPTDFSCADAGNLAKSGPEDFSLTSNLKASIISDKDTRLGQIATATVAVEAKDNIFDPAASENGAGAASCSDGFDNATTFTDVGNVLQGAIDDQLTTTSLTVDVSGGEDVGNLNVIKIDSEWMLVIDAPDSDEGKQTITVIRAVAGTTAAAHADNATVLKGAAVNGFDAVDTTGDCHVSGKNLVLDSCTFSATGWTRTTTNIVITSTDPNVANYGITKFTINRNPPKGAVDTDGDGLVDTAPPANCDTAGTNFPVTVVAYFRTPQTDDPAQVKANVGLDADGPNGTLPTIPQDPDADMVKDDFDGDGCTDWDELNPNFKIGHDPFNPDDCDFNWTGVFNLLVDATAVEKCEANTDIAAQPQCFGGSEDGLLSLPVNSRNTPNNGLPNDGTCQDTIDNDGDTLVDGADPDCGPRTDGTPSITTPGNSFHCITAQIHDKETNVVTGKVQCYADLVSLSSSQSAVPTNQNGSPGASPPPPYSVGHPENFSGAFCKTPTTNEFCEAVSPPPPDNSLVLNACFPGVGVTLGPSAIAQVVISGQTLTGTVNLFTQQTVANCNAGTPDGPPNPNFNFLTISLAEQPDGYDHDRDGCTDMEELLGTGAKCGDDPYNRFDTDDNLDSNVEILVTEIEQDLNVDGSYSHCVASIVHEKDTNDLTTTIFCYRDDPDVEVNDLAYPGFECLAGVTVPAFVPINRTCEGPNTGAGVVCAAGLPLIPCAGPDGVAPNLDDIPDGNDDLEDGRTFNFGDGSPGANPPGPIAESFIDRTEAPLSIGFIAAQAFGDVDATHNVWSGAGNFIDKGTNKAHIEGCLADVNNSEGPNIYWRVQWNLHTQTPLEGDSTKYAGQGTVDIWEQQDTCDKPAVTATHTGLQFEIAENASHKRNTIGNPETGADCLGLSIGVDDDGDTLADDGCPLGSAAGGPRDRKHHDTDRDGCSDTNELNDQPVGVLTAQQAGGLRDPYNTNDFFDPSGDGSVAFADFLQVLQHFNTNDRDLGSIPRNVPPYGDAAIGDEQSNSATETPPGIYSPRYDRGGTISGSNPWNEKPPNGSIGFPDFLSLLRQFGHSCSANI